MTIISTFSKLRLWLASPAVFGSISQKIPGQWHLYEYYRDWNEELLHIEEPELKEKAEFMALTFTGDEKFSITACLPVPFLLPRKQGIWHVHRNFISLVDADDFRATVEFQFAFEKDTLKLLKKDERGRIEFFGFFRQTDVSEVS